MLGPQTRPLDRRARALQFAVPWQTRWQGFTSSLAAVFGGPKAPKVYHGGPYLRDTWVRSGWPAEAVILSALLHILIVYIPFPAWSWFEALTEPPLPSRQQTELTYYGPLRDLPEVNAAGRPSRPSPPGEPEKPPPRRGADAFHPRQTIISAPRVPTHPRQTLIRPDAPPDPPKILPPLPNIVQWGDVSQPARPRLRISRDVLARMRPKRPASLPAQDIPAPAIPNLEKQPGELSIASSALAVAKPSLPVKPATVPQVGPRQPGGDAGLAPDVRPNSAGSDAGVGRLVAISPTPADASANLPVPTGNLAAQVSISPEARQPGSPGGSASGTPGGRGGTGGNSSSLGGNSGGGGTSPGTGGGGKNPAPGEVSITGGTPDATISGLRAAIASTPSPTLPPSPEPMLNSTPAPSDPEPAPASPPILGSVKPGAAPEEIFAPRRIYTLHVNMPNLSSVTGSWILNFVEMRQSDDSPSRSGGDLTGPVPLRKVDPRYPPAMMQAKVEGEVVLYAIIRRDGSVDSIQLVKGVEPVLDKNAMEALSRWRFRPAERLGTPVELEAIVHIPFRLAPRD